jgi:hypothetical protein
VKKKDIPKKQYPKTHTNYVIRQLRETSVHKSNPDKDLSGTEISLNYYLDFEDNKKIEKTTFNLEEVLEKQLHLVILGDGGMGKSTELDYWANYWSDNTTKYYPYRISLKNFLHQSIPQCLNENYPIWQEVENLVLLLDGLDETNNKFSNIIDIVNSFVEQYSTIKIVITCRPNFYDLDKTHKNILKGKLDKFNYFEFVPLSNLDIQNYCKNRKISNVENFVVQLSEQKLQDFATIPFYLEKLVDIFEDKGSLPIQRTELMEEIIAQRLIYEKADKGKKIADKKNAILDDLQKVAFVMTKLNKNQLTENEYHQIISDYTSRELIEQVAFWKKDIDTWQFEHNIFQEYLAAKFLMKFDVEDIEKIVCIAFENKPIIEFWSSALSFLAELYQDEKLYKFCKWVANKSPRILTTCSYANLNDELQLKLFKELLFNEELNKLYYW